MGYQRQTVRKEQLTCALGLGRFLLSKNPDSLQGQLIGKFIPTGLAYWNNRERDTFLEILPLGRETIAIDFICWVFRAYSDGEQYKISKIQMEKCFWFNFSIYLGFKQGRSDESTFLFSSSFKACCRLPDPPLIFALLTYGSN